MGGFWLLTSTEGSEVLAKMGERRGSGVLGVLLPCDMIGMVGGVFMVLDGNGVDVLGSIGGLGVSVESQDGVCAVDSVGLFPWFSDGSGWRMSKVWVCVWLCVVATGICLPGWSVLGLMYTGRFDM